MIILGDCLEELAAMPADKFDSMVTDPPAGISFMGKEWDSDKGGSEQWIAWLQEVMIECLRVLKPGAHALVWALPRTSHRTATALEQAGFEIRDIVVHIFGSGFPKSLNVGLAIDKLAGEPNRGKATHNIKGTLLPRENIDRSHEGIAYSPSTNEAKQWQGWGTALKPANEHWVLVRKPLGEKTVAKNVMKHGTGGLNIDASRIGNETISTHGGGDKLSGMKGNGNSGIGSYLTHQGRFPANLILSHHADCELLGTKEIKAISGGNKSIEQNKGNTEFNTCVLGANPYFHYGVDGKETVADYRCHDECAVAELDRQSIEGGMHNAGVARSKNVTSEYEASSYHAPKTRQMNRVGDTGGASRFFYCAKASKRDKGQDNTHPTVKSTKLMDYLIKLITPPEGLVLDPFAGSGSTGVAAKRAGFGFVGIEKNSDYHAIASKRLEVI